MKWHSVSFAFLALLGSGLAAYGDGYDTQPGGLRSVLRQASVRRSPERDGPTVVEPGPSFQASPAEMTNGGAIGSGAGGARRIFAGTMRNSLNHPNNFGEPAEAAPTEAMPAHEGAPSPGFVGGCCEDTKPCCNHLWDGFCEEKNCGCPKCSKQRGSCKQNCCRKPNCYRQDLFTWLKNQRAMKQAECGCESECAECGQASCNCGHVHSGHVHGEMKGGGATTSVPTSEQSPSDQFDTPAETAPREELPLDEATPEVPAPADEGQLEAPGNERAARKFGTPRNAFKPVRFRGN